MNNYRIAVIGQGYVGLPLAIEFGKKYQTIGYDIDKNRIEELKNSFDKTREASVKQIKNSIKLLESLEEFYLNHIKRVIQMNFSK